MAQFWTVYWGFCSFVFGAIVGSFLNVCIWRLPRGESLAKPPSHCPKCDHSLKLWPDMVPLCSQVWYRARCRYCGTPFSWRYFWIELLTAALFTGAYLRYAVFTNSRLDDFTQTAVLLCTFAFISCLVVIFFTDLDSYQIHDGTVALAALSGVVKDLLLIRVGERPLWNGVPGLPAAVQLPIPESVFSALISCWLLWQFAALVTAARGEEAMGGGDPLLLGAMGAVLLPWPLMVLAFIFAVFLGTIGGVGGSGCMPAPSGRRLRAVRSQPAIRNRRPASLKPAAALQVRLIPTIRMPVRSPPARCMNARPVRTQRSPKSEARKLSSV